jgi:hypothetical protein
LKGIINSCDLLEEKDFEFNKTFCDSISFEIRNNLFGLFRISVLINEPVGGFLATETLVIVDINNRIKKTVLLLIDCFYGK